MSCENIDNISNTCGQSIFSQYLGTCIHDAEDSGDNWLNTNCKSYEIDELDTVCQSIEYKYSVMHLNIHSLPAKHEQLQMLLAHFEQIRLYQPRLYFVV